MADEVKIIRIVVDSSKAVDGSAAATRALENIDRATNSLDGSMSRVEASLGGVSAMVKTQLALALAEAAAKLVNMAKEAFNAAAGLDELAEQMGINTGALQALQFAAVQGGVKLEQLETGITKFSDKIGQAAGGSKEMIKALDAVGVKILDAQGKLRPTEVLLTEVAAAITAIDDPARKTSAAIEFFGKSGAKLIPTLKDMAGGFDEMIAKAKAGGAFIEADTIAKLDKLADSSERGKLALRAFFAETTAGPLIAVLDEVSKRFGQIVSYIRAIKGDWTSAATHDSFAGQKNALAIKELEGDFERSVTRHAALSPGPGEVETSVRRAARLREEALQSGILEKLTKERAEQRRIEAMTGRNVGLVDDVPRSSPLPPNGLSNPKPEGSGGGGDDPEKKYQKLEQQLKNTAEAQAKMTAAALHGDQAFEGMKAELDASQKLLEIYGSKLAIPADRLKIVTDLLKDIAQGKGKEAFAVQTTEIEKANNLLEAQIRLFDAAPDVQARELAIIKATNEAKKAGESLDSDAFKARLAQLETGEKLKIQYDELKKASELWVQPLRTALDGIQSAAANAFDAMLQSGNISFQSLGDAFKATIRQMIAQLLALALVRPVVSVGVQALSGAGIISQSTAASMGFGSSGDGTGMFGGFGGGLSNLTMPSWLGGGQPLSFLSQPMFPGSMPEGMFGPAAPGLGGATWMQGLGALAGAGMGIYQLMSGNGSTSSTIGGISSIVGAGVSLIPGIGQIAGPAIALLGNLLPGLLGLDKPPTITNQEYGDVTYGANGFFTSGGAWGPSANARNLQGPLGQVGASMQGILGALGGVKDPSKVWGIALQSFAQQSGNNNFSNQTSFLAGPNGERIQWGQGSTAQDIGMEAAGVAATLKSIMEGAVGQISENLKKGLATVNTDGHGTFAQLATVVAEIKSFDDAVAGLGKTITSAEDAIKKIDDSFAAMYATADKYGLTTSDVDAAKAKARLDYSTDFGKSISRQILEITDPKAAALQDLDSWRTTMVDNNKWLLENVTGTLDQINEIEKLYGLKRAQIAEQSAQQSLNSLVDVIKRLTYGDLSGATPENVLSGTRGTYSAMLAKARAGDQGAIASLGGAAADYASAAKDFYAISPQYNAITAGLRGDLAAVAANNGGAELLAGLPQAIGILGQVLADLTMNMKAANEDNAALKAQIAELTALFQRVANG